MSSIPPLKKSQTGFIVCVWDEYKVIKPYFGSNLLMTGILKLTVNFLGRVKNQLTILQLFYIEVKAGLTKSQNMLFRHESADTELAFISDH